MSTAPPTRQFTISFPEDLAQKVDQLARQLRARMKQTQQLAATSKPKHKKSETRLLLQEARQEMKAAEKK